MAKLSLAAPVSGIRGKVGGLIYSANKSGPYVKAWGRGSNPRTERQTAHRADFTRFTQSWAGITAAQRTAWDVYAALPAQDKTDSLGETYSVSGFSWFVALTLNLNAAGASQIDSAPVLGTPATPVINNLIVRETASASNTRFQLTAGSPDLTFIHAIHATIYNSEGHTVQAEVRPFMIAEVFTGTRAFFFQDELDATFGTIQIDQNCFATIAAQNSEGRRGAVASADSLAIA